MNLKIKSFIGTAFALSCAFYLQTSSNLVYSLDFNVGQGQEWDTQVLAPFVDMSTCISNDEYSNNGATRLLKLYEDTNIKTYNLGFINAKNDDLKSNNTLNWSWGGYTGLNEEENDNHQYEGIKQSIREIRSVGGDVIVSIGGPNEMHFFQATENEQILINTYQEIIDGYNLTKINLDIEGEALGYDNNAVNAKALKHVQENTAVEISLTLPATPSGLTDLSKDSLNAYLDQEVNIKTINIINTCHDDLIIDESENYGEASIESIVNLKNQLFDIYSEHDRYLSNDEIYGKIGITISINPNEYLYPVCTTECSESVIEFSKKHKIGMVSFISIFDYGLSTDDEIDDIYEYADIFHKYKQSSAKNIMNTPPTISGVINKTIYKGDTFDAKEKIIATDKEDGLLNVICIGQVDTSQLGNYNLTYSAVDSKGASITANRTISVVAKPTPATSDYLHWNRADEMAGIYSIGTIVSHKGQYYKKIALSSWWSEPGSNRLVWQLINNPIINN